MKLTLPPFKTRNLFLAVMLLKAVSGAYAADQELLDILLQNGAITQAQHNELLKSESLTSEDILQSPVTVERLAEVTEEVVASEVARQIDSNFPVTAERVGSGFRFATRDGNWRTDLQWRAQTRYTTPVRSDPRQISSFNAEDQSNFEARRLRMKIGEMDSSPGCSTILKLISSHPEMWMTAAHLPARESLTGVLISQNGTGVVFELANGKWI